MIPPCEKKQAFDSEVSPPIVCSRGSQPNLANS